MEIDPLAAVVAGLVAAQCMEVPAYTQRAMGLGLRQDISAEGGSILRAPRRYLRLAGWVGHGLLAVAIVLMYSTFFAAVGNDIWHGGGFSPAPLMAHWAGWSSGRGRTCTRTSQPVSSLQGSFIGSTVVVMW